MTAGAAAGAGALLGRVSVAAASPVTAVRCRWIRTGGGTADGAGVQYRFYPGSTLEPFATSPAATVTKIYAGNGRAYAVPTTGGAYLALAIDVPNASTLVEISFVVFAPGNLNTHVLLDHYQPGTPTVLAPLVDRDITGAGFETLTVPLDTKVDYGADAYAAYVFSIGVDQQVAGIRLGYRQHGDPLVPINPSRVYDSRLAGGKLADGEERTVSTATAIQGADVLPAGATAVAMTLTVTETEGSGGYVSAFPFGIAWPGTSSINWFGPGQNLATAVIVAVGGDRQLVLRGGVQPTHVVIDVTGYLA
jgi:hypothetical protein